MHIQSLYIDNYFHLEKLNLDFKKPITVFIGENGSGKSTLLEAIISIFRNLFYTESLPVPFRYIIKYAIASHSIEISTMRDTYEIKIDGKKIEIVDIQKISKTWIHKKIPEQLEGILPDNILMYYSGQSERIAKHFEKIETDYLESLKNGHDLGFKPMFLLRPIHYKIILLGLLASKLEGIKTFLDKNFSIKELKSFDIRLKRPSWSNSSKAKVENFWNAQNIVSDYLIAFKEKSSNEVRLTTDTVIYQYGSENLERIIDLPFIGYESNLVKILDSLYTAGFIEDLEIAITLTNNKEILFENLSEGEQQLLAIKGMTELLRGRDTLYLLDEPDNYLHPIWQEDLLKELANYADNTHFFVTTHSPQLLTNANPKFSEVLPLIKGKLEESTSQYFGKDINSILNNVMDANYRNSEIDLKLNSLFKEIALKDVGKSEEIYSKLLEILGEDDPKLVAAKSEIDFLKYSNDEADS